MWKIPILVIIVWIICPDKYLLLKKVIIIRKVSIIRPVHIIIILIDSWLMIGSLATTHLSVMNCSIKTTYLIYSWHSTKDISKSLSL